MPAADRTCDLCPSCFFINNKIRRSRVPWRGANFGCAANCLARADRFRASHDRMTSQDVKARLESLFWLFPSTFRFHAAQVAAACLDLQDQAGLMINIVMFLLLERDAERSLRLQTPW